MMNPESRFSDRCNNKESNRERISQSANSHLIGLAWPWLISVSLDLTSPYERTQGFDYFKAWLLFFVVATGGMLLVGIVVNSFLAALLVAGGAPGGQTNRILMIVGLLIGLSIHYVTFRAVVGKYLFPKIEEDAPRLV